MEFNTIKEHIDVLNSKSHIVVIGGPGAGKTTLALRKAMKSIEDGLQEGQKVLFLSFSRSAVSRIVETARSNFSKKIICELEIETFHSFHWKLLQAFGYFLGPKKITLISPQEERTIKSGDKIHKNEWDHEFDRIFKEEGRIIFDLFASKAALLLEKSLSLRELISNRYPLIIIDEAQDTGTIQWKFLEFLSNYSQLFFLADINQQIYDFRDDVSPNRVNEIVSSLNPLVIDISSENNRSPGLDILEFGYDILRNSLKRTPYQSISHFTYSPAIKDRDKKIRASIGILYRTILDRTGSKPESIGILTNWGKGVTVIARALQGQEGQRAIRHKVHMDEVMVFLAARVIAFCMEPIEDLWTSLSTTLIMISEMYKAKGNQNKFEMLNKNALKIKTEASIKGNGKCQRVLKEILSDLQFSGNPTQDWMMIRHKFCSSNVEELMYVDSQVTYLMAFQRGKVITEKLSETWMEKGRYEMAQSIIENAINASQILGEDNNLDGINVMTMHKSKGKEFDGVIVIDMGHISPLITYDDKPPYKRSRRLLHVAITRAKKHVLLLTDASNPSPLLDI